LTIIKPAIPKEEDSWWLRHGEENIAVVIFMIISFMINANSHNEFTKGYPCPDPVSIDERLLT
jgi:hypothetical protein